MNTIIEVGNDIHNPKNETTSTIRVFMMCAMIPFIYLDNEEFVGREGQAVVVIDIIVHSSSCLFSLL